MSSNAVVELKGGMYTLMSLRLHSSDINEIDTGLADKVHQAPGFFSNTPVVVDLSEIESEDDFDPALLLAKIRSHNLIPVIASVLDKSASVATRIELPLVETTRRDVAALPSGKKTAVGDPGVDSEGKSSLLGGSRMPDGTGSSERTSDDEDSGDQQKHSRKQNGSVSLDSSLDNSAGFGKHVEYVPAKPLMITRPVRSGQQLYARDSDLIVMAHVGPGAEIVADNNVHVYGPLRGRALCGVTGNTESRIFCQSLEAELVSVAGNYKVLEEIPEELRGKPAQIWYQEGRINIDPL